MTREELESVMKELVAAAEGCSDFFRDNDDFRDGHPTPDFIQALRAALAKANGEEQ